MEGELVSADYEAVLRDLRERRDKLDAAIVAMEEIIGVAAPAGRVPAVVGGEYSHMTVMEAAVAFLRKMGRPQSTSKIQRALRTGGYPTDSKNFYNTVFGTLTRAAHERNAQVVKVNSEWALREWTKADKPE